MVCEKTKDEAAEIEITEAMEHAGFDVLDDWTGVLDKATLAREVYIAMVRAKSHRKSYLASLSLMWKVQHHHILKNLK